MIFSTFIVLQNELKNTIQTLLQESRVFNTNDILVDLNKNSPKLFQFTDFYSMYNLSEFPANILRETEQTLKESGVNALCITKGCVDLQLQRKRVKTPVILIPLLYKRNKVKQTLSFEPQFEEAFLNPFLIDYLREHGIEPNHPGIIDAEGELNAEPLFEELENKSIMVVQGFDFIVGNFHHHRYKVIKELEEILAQDVLSPQLISLLGYGIHEEPTILDLSCEKLFSSDTDHEQVFKEANTQNIVIQGPPGTGKSQVLTNLGAKLLAGGYNSIYVSEKRAALDVIRKKLAEFGLDKFCYIATADQTTHDFLQALKETWGFLEQHERTPVNNMNLSEQYAANLQMTLDLLNQDSLIGGVSYHDFKSGMNGTKVSMAKYNSSVIDIPAFQQKKSLVKEIYNKDLNKTVGYFKEATLKSERFAELDQEIRSADQLYGSLKSQINIDTWGELCSAMNEAAQCQILDNETYKKYAEIYKSNSPAQRKFLKLRKKWLTLHEEMSTQTEQPSHWKTTPSEEEARALQTDIGKKGILRKLKARRRWSQLSNISFDHAEGALKAHAEQLKKKVEISQLKIKFCDLGIESPENDLILIYQTLTTLNQDQWRQIEQLSAEERIAYTRSHAILNTIYSTLRSKFVLQDDTSINDFFHAVERNWGNLVAMHSQLQLLIDIELRAIERNSTFEALKEELFNSHWVNFQERFPHYAGFKMNDLREKVNNVVAAEKEEAKLFAAEIIEKQWSLFNKYHELLNTPARKLCDDDKQLKAELRKGKSILVKEFAKTRSHPTLRQLYHSEARKWITLLKPIWLSNPTELAKCFPMETELFEFAIFDEASQIPLQNALGAMQRCKRAIVAGDEHQMGPTSYFQAGPTEVIDLLHQANFYWPKVELKHHYRSVHPDLIAFSNKHFYNEELKAYPAQQNGQSLYHHFVENGIYADRKNIIEAKSVADRVESLIDSKKVLGIVAFSEEQLKCIWDELSPKVQEKLSGKIEADQAFFKALENVQGDECDALIISFGFGKNHDGEFHLRFGPMNQGNGRRRLNVLLTRARESIDFYCSVKAADFKLSENESVNLLRMWMLFSENHQEEHSHKFPFGIKPKIDGKQLIISQIQNNFTDARELVTLQSVLESRGWQVQYE